MRDLIIAGGGPAGLGAAIMAAQAGLEPTVIEPRVGVIDKACGEGLMPGAVAILEEIGVQPLAGYPFVGVRYLDERGTAEGRFATGEGLGVRRTVLHAALQERARQLGVRFEEGRVNEVHQSADSVEVNGMQARWLFAADGLYSSIRKSLDLERPARHAPRFGLRRHYQVAPWSPFVEVYWTESAEAYVTPVAEDLVGVAILFYGEPLPDGKGSEDRYNRLLRDFPALAERLQEPVTAVRGSGPFERRVASRRAGRVLLVGDAAGYLDPITGEGIRLGLASAAAAVGCIQAGRPEDYERAWRRATRSYWWLTEGLLLLRNQPPLRRMMIPVLGRAPGAFSRIVGVLGG
jgi:flavin-dependent dehydrogenase